VAGKILCCGIGIGRALFGEDFEGYSPVEKLAKSPRSLLCPKWLTPTRAFALFRPHLPWHRAYRARPGGGVCFAFADMPGVSFLILTCDFHDFVVLRPRQRQNPNLKV
jgi:hypothetical protein